MGVTPGAVGAGGAVRQPREDFAKLMRDFTNMGGKNFSGAESVIEVQEWLETCNEIFGDLELEDALKKRLASRQLLGRAKSWWNTVITVTPEDEITWEQFRAKFKEKFILTSQKIALFNKFVDLT